MCVKEELRTWQLICLQARTRDVVFIILPVILALQRYRNTDYHGELSVGKSSNWSSTVAAGFGWSMGAAFFLPRLMAVEPEILR